MTRVIGLSINRYGHLMCYSYAWRWWVIPKDIGTTWKQWKDPRL
jgi:hypothetical protein